jgi:HD-like signal output (HDOD) protein/CheY-like chemotaxis protein
MKRILFVDDESKILDGIRRMLYSQRGRWDIQFAIGGEAALQACEKCSFDVVVSDMRMPGMDGATLLGHIRDRYPSTARLILSGYSESALARRAVPVAHRFLSKPCSAAALQSTIERVCSLQEAVSTPEIRRLVGSVGELPSLSTTYEKLTEAVSNPDSSITQVAEIIEEDIAMSAKILQLVNSAFFGLAQKITNISTSVSYLGMETIKNLALASEAFRILVPDNRIPHGVCEAMQNHAHRSSAIAAALPMDMQIREVAIVATLLHDIGSLFLASSMPDKFSAAHTLASEKKCPVFQAEEELLGTSHAEIGAYLLGLWGLPNLAVEAIAHHHHPTRIPHIDFDCTAVVYVADMLVWELQAHPQGSAGLPIEESNRDCLQALGVLPRLDEFRELALRSLD